jgi:hypothetical protein
MSSIREQLLGVGCCAVALVALGCQRTIPNTADRLSNAPLIVDEAMQMRDWDRTIAHYPNGDTVAGGNGYMFRTHETIPEPYRRVVEPAVAATNIGLLPVGVIFNSPFTAQVHEGVIIPPTHHAMPPLP